MGRCRLLSSGEITCKIYSGEKEELQRQGQASLSDNHLLLLVAAGGPSEVISVELWPTPVTEPLGFLECDLSAAGRVGTR